MEQAGFSFDSVLEHIPASQLRPTAVIVLPDKEAFVEQLRAVLPSLPDDIDIDAPLLAVGLQPHSLTGWHRSRSMDALIGFPPIYQAYDADPDPNDEGKHKKLIRKMRFRRLPPMELCPGFEDEPCTVLTRGGVRCDRHLATEEESLWNFD